MWKCLSSWTHHYFHPKQSDSFSFVPSCSFYVNMQKQAFAAFLLFFFFFQSSILSQTYYCREEKQSGPYWAGQWWNVSLVHLPAWLVFMKQLLIAVKGFVLNKCCKSSNANFSMSLHKEPNHSQPQNWEMLLCKAWRSFLIYHPDLYHPKFIYEVKEKYFVSVTFIGTLKIQPPTPQISLS